MKLPTSKPPVSRHGSSKPALRMRKIKLAGRSAFPSQKTAFGPPNPLLGSPSASGAPSPIPAASGDPLAPIVPGAAGPGSGGN